MRFVSAKVGGRIGGDPRWAPQTDQPRSRPANDGILAYAVVALAHRPAESRPERHRLRCRANVGLFISELDDELLDDSGADVVAAAT